MQRVAKLQWNFIVLELESREELVQVVSLVTRRRAVLDDNGVPALITGHHDFHLLIKLVFLQVLYVMLLVVFYAVQRLMVQNCVSHQVGTRNEPRVCPGTPEQPLNCKQCSQGMDDKENEIDVGLRLPLLYSCLVKVYAETQSGQREEYNEQVGHGYGEAHRRSTQRPSKCIVRHSHRSVLEPEGMLSFSYLVNAPLFLIFLFFVHFMF